jgi:plasmid replication initiation protein
MAKDDTNVLEEKEFPKKYAKHLPPDFKETADSMTDEELNKVILECQEQLYNLNKEKENDPKLNAAKELVKDLSGAYKDTASPYVAKLQYSLFTLDGRGKL